MDWVIDQTPHIRFAPDDCGAADVVFSGGAPREPGGALDTPGEGGHLDMSATSNAKLNRWEQ